MNGLVIKEQWADLILSGEKTLGDSESSNTSAWNNRHHQEWYRSDLWDSRTH
jgi:hypothetical protein